MKPVTELIHHSYKAPSDFAAPQIATHKASTVIFPNVQAMRERTWLDKKGYTYGLHGTPTTFTLEERICYLEGAQHAVLVPSGLAAIALANMALLKHGDEILLPDNVYGPHKTFAEGELKQWGITYQLYDPMDLADLSSRITPQTRLIWLEAAGSVTLEFPDVVEMVRLARSKGVLTALDNTWGAGLAFAVVAISLAWERRNSWNTWFQSFPGGIFLIALHILISWHLVTPQSDFIFVQFVQFNLACISLMRAMLLVKKYFWLRSQ
jgi:cystathionine beta-lyase/cystathionine gamma-synthase